MRIKSLIAYQLPVLLKKPIQHASHIRTHNQTLIVRSELADGSVGWGEGLPRTYVTGESIDSVWRHLTSTDFQQLADIDFDAPLDVVNALDSFRLADVPADEGVIIRACFGNSVRCALEVALLDAVCRSSGCSVGDAIQQLPHAAKIRHSVQHVRYSGVVTSTSPMGQWRSALKMRLFGFKQIKAKVGTVGIDDTAFLRRIRKVVSEKVDLRLDANEAWHGDEVVSKMKLLLPFGISSLEQPVPHAEVSVLAEVRKQLAVPIMLDESVCSLEDAATAIADKTCDAFNLRLSKCGGIVNCVRLAAMASSNGLGYQLGCQVGETGILSAAGRHFACNIAGCLYLEGSYDRFLVRDAMTEQDLTFHYGGKAPRLQGLGLGITVKEATIQSKSIRTESLLSG